MAPREMLAIYRSKTGSLDLFVPQEWISATLFSITTIQLHHDEHSFHLYKAIVGLFQLRKPIVLARCTLDSVIAQPGRLQLYLHIPALSHHASADPSRRTPRLATPAPPWPSNPHHRHPHLWLQICSPGDCELHDADRTNSNKPLRTRPAQSEAFWRTPSTLKVRTQSLSEISSSHGPLAISSLRRKARAIFNFLSATGGVHDVKLSRYQQLH